MQIYLFRRPALLLKLNFTQTMACSMTGPTAALHRRQCDMLLKHLDHMRGDMVLLDTHMQVAPVARHTLQT